MSPNAELAPGVWAAELPPMPSVAGQALLLLQDPDTTADQLRAVIECDPALTATVLRLANSALFTLLKPVTTLKQAIILIGFLRLRSLIFTSVASRLRDAIPPEATEQRWLIWEHAIVTALGARYLVEKRGEDWYEEAFICGLLHDCGRLVLLGQKTDDYVDLMLQSGGALPLPGPERQRIGIDHQQIGRMLLEQWNLGPLLAETAGAHHGTDLEASPHAVRLAPVVLTDRLFENASEDPIPAAARLGYKAEKLDELSLDVRRSIADGLSVLRGM
ncbi:MAG: HDOD domain-containing protein [Acidobacteria bacterium]|nr:HDOD domain-containing protein [Acidobacteriota bacterium]